MGCIDAHARAHDGLDLSLVRTVTRVMTDLAGQQARRRDECVRFLRQAAGWYLTWEGERYGIGCHVPQASCLPASVRR